MLSCGIGARNPNHVLAQQNRLGAANQDPAGVRAEEICEPIEGSGCVDSE